MKQIKISEEQDREIKNKINEFLDPNGGSLQLKYSTPTTPKTPGEIGSTIVNATKAAERVPSNPNIDNSVSITADPDNDNKQQQITVSGDNNVSESVIITMKQLNEMRLRKLKENSDIVKIDKFLK